MTDTPSPTARAEALKPCPACNRPLDLHENDWCDPPEWHAYCSGCGLHFRASSVKETAIAYANNRPALDAAREMVTELVEVLEHEGHGEFAGERSICVTCQKVKKAKAFLAALPANTGER